jgi:hypothetical protein
MRSVVALQTQVEVASLIQIGGQLFREDGNTDFFAGNTSCNITGSMHERAVWRQSHRFNVALVEETIPDLLPGRGGYCVRHGKLGA